MEGATVVDADSTDVARDNVLERRVSGGARTQHRRARSVNMDVLEMDVRDGVEILHREVGNEQDRVVRALQEVVAGNLDVRRDRAFERVDPDRSQADFPIELKRASPHGRVVREPEIDDEWGRAEARSRVEAAALAHGVGDDIIRHRVVATTVDGDSVREHRVLHRVVVEHIAGVLDSRLSADRLRPHRERVITRVADERIDDLRVCHSLVEVDAVGDLVHDDRVLDRHVVHRSVEPDTDFRVLDVEAIDR